MFSRPVRSSSTVNSCGTSPMDLRTWLGCFTESKPQTLHDLPLVGRSKVVSILMVVVFPAPFGPQEAEDLALGNFERYVVHRSDGTVVDLHQVLHFY